MSLKQTLCDVISTCKVITCECKHFAQKNIVSRAEETKDLVEVALSMYTN